MTRVLLVNTSITANGPRNYPYGLGILGAVLAQNGIAADCIDLKHVSLPQLEQALGGASYDFVGVSGMIATFVPQREVIEVARRALPGAVIGSGGGLATAIEDSLLELLPDLDVAFLGEGERSLIAFLRAMGGSVDHVPGIVYHLSGVFDHVSDSRDPVSAGGHGVPGGVDDMSAR